MSAAGTLFMRRPNLEILHVPKVSYNLSYFDLRRRLPSALIARTSTCSSHLETTARMRAKGKERDRKGGKRTDSARGKERGESLTDIEDLMKVGEIKEGERQSLRDDMLAWYDGNRRKLPWRGDGDPGRELQLGECGGGDCGEGTGNKDVSKSVSAYETWVSEIMCQQTRVETVVGYFRRWMDAFPTVHELAAASIEDVNRLW